MSKLKAGVIGAGVFGGHHARKYQSDPRIDLVGVYDLDDERRAVLAEDLGVQAFESMDALLAAIDLVTIASPPVTHAGAGLAALTSGKHVLVEKPIATTIADAEALIAAADDKQRVLACGHQERLVFDAMGLFATGARPRRIESVREGPWTGRSADVSVTLDLMVHDFDLALTLMGAAPQRVEAAARTEHGPSADQIDARLGFEGGATALFTASRIAPARKRSMRIVYEQGEVTIDFLARSFANTTPFALNADFSDTPNGKDPLGANVLRFIDACAGAAPRPVVSGAEALAALRIGLAADAAAGLPSVSL
jgi:predicted dehydrogenase